MAESVAKQKSYAFALGIVHLCARLKEQKHFEIASQLLRCGTSIGANVEEALAGCSRKEFAAKMSIASKEAREANYWLRFPMDARIVIDEEASGLLQQSEERLKILTSIVKTTMAREGMGRSDSRLKTKNSRQTG